MIVHYVVPYCTSWSTYNPYLLKAIPFCSTTVDYLNSLFWIRSLLNSVQPTFISKYGQIFSYQVIIFIYLSFFTPSPPFLFLFFVCVINLSSLSHQWSSYFRSLHCPTLLMWFSYRCTPAFLLTSPWRKDKLLKRVGLLFSFQEETKICLYIYICIFLVDFL